MPTPNARPDKEIIFMVMFVKYISTIANNTLSGMLNATTTVGRTSFRNSINTSTARSAPNIRLDNTDLIMILM